MTSWAEMQERLSTQDNRCTSEPIFYVRTCLPNTWQWQALQPFLTQAGADQFIKDNAHNLTEPHVYIGSGFNNPEWLAMRRAVATLARFEATLSFDPVDDDDVPEIKKTLKSRSSEELSAELDGWRKDLVRGVQEVHGTEMHITALSQQLAELEANAEGKS